MLLDMTDYRNVLHISQSMPHTTEEEIWGYYRVGKREREKQRMRGEVWGRKRRSLVSVYAARARGLLNYQLFQQPPSIRLAVARMRERIPEQPGGFEEEQRRFGVQITL